MFLEAGQDTYVEPGFTASDSFDGDLTKAVLVTSTLPARLTPGNYTIAYRVSDSAINTVAIARTVVVRDTLPPVITLLGAKSMSVTTNTTFSDPGYTALDANDGDVTALVTVLGSASVNTSLTGAVYSIVYRVSDRAGLVGTQTRTVTITSAEDSSASSSAASSTPIIVGVVAAVLVFFGGLCIFFIVKRQARNKTGPSVVVPASHASEATYMNADRIWFHGYISQ